MMCTLEMSDLWYWEIFPRLKPIDLQMLRKANTYFAKMINHVEIKLSTADLELTHIKKWTNIDFPVQAVFKTLKAFIWFMQSIDLPLQNFDMCILENASLEVFIFAKNYVLFSPLDLSQFGNVEILKHEIVHNEYVIVYDIVERDLLDCYILLNPREPLINAIITHDSYKIMNYVIHNHFVDVIELIYRCIHYRKQNNLRVLLLYYIKNFENFQENIFQEINSVIESDDNNFQCIHVEVEKVLQVYTFDNFLQMEAYEIPYSPVISLAACVHYDIEFINYLLDNNYEFHEKTCYYMAQNPNLQLFKRVYERTGKLNNADIIACLENNIEIVKFIMQVKNIDLQNLHEFIHENIKDI